MSVHLSSRRHVMSLLALFSFVVWGGMSRAADILEFVGTYTGSASLEQADGTKIPRDMSVVIGATKNGFEVQWESTSYRPDKRIKTKSYAIKFLPTERDDVYAAAMQRNVFGHQVPLNPMKGEPYVWARIEGDTLSVFSLHVRTDGGYEIQQYDRTLAEGGLTLEYQRIADGAISRKVTTFLTKQ